MAAKTNPGTPADIPSADPPIPVTQTIVLQPPAKSRLRVRCTRILAVGLIASLVTNLVLYISYQDYFSAVSPPTEKFHSGDRAANNKIAVLRMSATIMPPFTERMLRSIKRATEDDSVKGVVLVIDSPGGLVADSHQIYHRLQALSKAKPMVVAMKRIAASGGYYIAMGAGPDATIYVEPTTWTGSIGVIIPRYNASGLASKIGVVSEPLKTGRFKDSLNPFRDLHDAEITLWRTILHESFEQFLTVIADNRPRMYRKDQRLFGMNAAAACAMRDELDPQTGTAVEDVATGRIFTANQALAVGLVDKIGFVDDAIAELKDRLDMDSIRVVQYQHPQTILGLFAGSMKAQQPEQRWQALMDATVPRAMYYCAGLPVITVRETSGE